ncbi:protein mono-ADP-ribosyltransferase PARP4-like [Varanus komodoensis]|uniref:protein mono-ADP-ribosyltransferase PARP4-like n=1 Tax=Varanus komodoensis TaxID=61221 RepID=UPI001CF7ACCF|nr:protein mono-ADP-ribosyltransferase PARP4-like [Varanus komodoensis]
MKEAIFANCVFFLRLTKLHIREKNRLKNSIKENGGKIQFVLNQECTHVVTDFADALSSTHLKSIRKFQLPVVDVDFIQDSVDVGELLQADDYEPHKALAWAAGVPVDLVHGDDNQKEKDTTKEDNKNQSIDSSNIDSLRWLSHDSENIPDFPEDFEVAKYAILEKVITFHVRYQDNKEYEAGVYTCASL